MDIQEVIRTIDQIQADGIIDRYAIGRAVGATFHLQRGGAIPAAIPFRHPITNDLQAILESKCRYRQRLAARPVAEKLRILDAMRERALLLRPAATSILREEPAPYGGKKSNP